MREKGMRAVAQGSAPLSPSPLLRNHKFVPIVLLSPLIPRRNFMQDCVHWSSLLSSKRALALGRNGPNHVWVEPLWVSLSLPAISAVTNNSISLSTSRTVLASLFLHSSGRLPTKIALIQGRRRRSGRGLASSAAACARKEEKGAETRTGAHFGRSLVCGQGIHGRAPKQRCKGASKARTSWGNWCSNAPRVALGSGGASLQTPPPFRRHLSRWQSERNIPLFSCPHLSPSTPNLPSAQQLRRLYPH